MVNKHEDHVLVLPEDDANRQLANGFHLQIGWSQQRQMQVLRVAGGWNKVLTLFRSVHVKEMNRWPKRFMVLLIDFDDTQERLRDAEAAIPGNLAQRVFVLGALTEPEVLRADLGTYETIGKGMADDCREETDTTWGHHQLRHNASELDRLRRCVRPILFPPVLSE